MRYISPFYVVADLGGMWSEGVPESKISRAINHLLQTSEGELQPSESLTRFAYWETGDTIENRFFDKSPEIALTVWLYSASGEVIGKYYFVGDEMSFVPIPSE